MQSEIPPIIVRQQSALAPESIFDAWVDPAVAKQWLFATPGGEIVRCDIDARPGGTFVITDRRAGDDVAHHGTFLQVDRPRRLVFQFSVPKYSSVITTVTIDLTPTASGTDVILTHENVLAAWAASTEQGWRDLLAGLERHQGR